MMKKIFLLQIFFMICLAVNAQNKKAASYNNQIIDIQHGLTPKVVKFLKNFESKEKFESITVAEIRAQKNSLADEFDKAIKKVVSAKPFEEDATLKDAALKWFVLYMQTLNQEYDLLINNLSKKNRNEEDKIDAKKIIEDMHKREEAIDKEFEDAQISFAKKYNLEIKNYPIEQ